MGLSYAVSFEGRLRRDRMSLMLKLEILVIFSTALAVLYLTEQPQLAKLFFAALTAVSVFLVAKDRVEKAGRRLRRAVVRSVKQRGNDWFFFLPMTPSFAFTANGYEVEAVSEDMTVLKFFDWRPWRTGQKLLVLSDIRGKVLAVRDFSSPVKMEVLRKLLWRC
ncbi:MAG: hypothetical protein NZ570_05365 [Candidatus Caldarchaeum sp.]|nr:hypothetical protein [Candidatus Caldarchaeum sp.]MDW8359314.1 hypothetical protein [Candidatus Caldarchaeum sp.]